MHRKITVAINGFGRIGRCVTRAIYENNEYRDIFELKIINTPSENKTITHLLKYDSSHGIFKENSEYINESSFSINNTKIQTCHSKNISDVDLSGIDILFECTGKFLSTDKLQDHLKTDVKKIILSAPPKDKEIKTIVYGVNHNQLNKNDRIVSIGSCTTNCLAPIAKIIHDNFKIQNGFITTVHAFTNDQNILDNSHKSDLRRARTATESIIPTSTGAASSIGVVIPELNGKLHGMALRVPVKNVSVIDCVFNVSQNVSIQDVLTAIKHSERTEMRDIIKLEENLLVSCDFNHTSESSIIDSHEIKVNDKSIKILSWYDNEWAFSNRMLDVAKLCFDYEK